MEILEIRNFLTIREARVEVRPFTLLIGPQANGKSVVAKALYFFRDFLNTQFTESIGDPSVHDKLVNQAVAKFEEIFPRYSWGDQDFSLIYRTDAFSISLTRESSTAPVSFSYSEQLAALQREAQAVYDRRLDEMDNLGRKLRPFESFKIRSVWFETLAEVILRAPIGRYFHGAVFIPATRSFFATIQKNVFALLLNEIVIDPLIAHFGSMYERSKRLLSRDADDVAPLAQMMSEDVEQVLAGQYRLEDDQDWIVTNGRRINLANASSGQQEALPMLLVLLDRASWEDNDTTFFIEEPEAHLFPVSQKKIVGIFATLYNALNHRFVLTTHSPYILTALNNLILASNVVRERPEAEDEVREIIGGERMVRFEDVSAYTIRDGVLESILDEENRLIGASVIDSVSDEFDRVFDRLLEAETA